MVLKLAGELPGKGVCSIEEAVECLPETPDELSKLTENEFLDSDSDIIEPECEEFVVLSEGGTDVDEPVSQHHQEDSEVEQPESDDVVDLPPLPPLLFIPLKEV